MFKQRGTYFLFARGLLTQQVGGPVVIKPEKTFHFVAAFPAGNEWTSICNQWISLFGKDNITYRFRPPLVDDDDDGYEEDDVFCQPVRITDHRDI